LHLLATISNPLAGDTRSTTGESVQTIQKKITLISFYLSIMNQGPLNPLVAGCALALITLYIFSAVVPETANSLLPLVVSNTFMGNFFVW